MGYWGVAMSLYHPIWVPPTPADLKKGRAAVEKAKAAGAKTQRERDYIAAIEVFYRDSDKVASPGASARVAQRHATAFGALSGRPRGRDLLCACADWNRASHRQDLRHPEASRRNSQQVSCRSSQTIPASRITSSTATIHRTLPALALPAARSYAKIAPASPHALHMPSHIFTRLGLWQDSIQSNLASAAAAKNHLARIHPGAASQDQLHAMDYLVYAYLQSCQDGKAKRVVEEAAAVTKVDAEVFQAAYAFAAIPARYALERRRWSEAAALEVRPAAFPWDHFRYAEAITYFARAMGLARSGDTASARKEIEKLASIQKALEQAEGNTTGKRR